MCTMFFLTTLLFSLLVPLTQAHPESPCTNCTINRVNATYTSPGEVAINTSPLAPFDDVKLSSANATAWESYIFEGVSDTGTSGVVVTFFRDPSVAALGLGVIRATVEAVWENGTKWTTTIYPGESLVTSCDEATYGYWNTSHLGTKFSFAVPSTLRWAKLNLAGADIRGAWEMNSTAPAITADGLVRPNAEASVEMAPMVYWNEPLPAAALHASFTLGGSHLTLKGYGGHGRNWAAYNWDSLALGWHRVRAVAGPYTLVFWHFISAVDRKTYTSTFLSYNGSRVFSTRNVNVENGGDYGTFQLIYGGKVHGTFADLSTGMVVELAEVQTGKRWRFDLNHENVLHETPHGTYSALSRFVNTVHGGEVGGQVWEGAAISEQSTILKPAPL